LQIPFNQLNVENSQNPDFYLGTPGITPTATMALLEELLTQLRTTWPMAAVLAEFVTVQDGQFIVRALVQVGGVSLASGLASATTVEGAEDRAKERAIQALGIAPVAPQTSGFSPMSTASTGMASAAIAPPSPPPISPSLPLPPLPTPPPPIPPTPPINLDEDFSGSVVADLYSHAAYNPPDDLEEAPDPQQVLAKMVPASTLLSKTSSEDDASPPSDSKKPRRKEPKTEPPKIPDSVDLSDVIAQTDVELQRLGWSRIQGRDYLLQTYSKKTRSELSELELYEFLSHLKAQPSPSTL